MTIVEDEWSAVALAHATLVAPSVSEVGVTEVGVNPLEMPIVEMDC